MAWKKAVAATVCRRCVKQAGRPTQRSSSGCRQHKGRVSRMKIEGIVTIVTGGASGLGRATAERLVAQGAKVVIADLPGSNGESVAQAAGGNVRFVAADVTNTEQRKAVFD